MDNKSVPLDIDPDQHQIQICSAKTPDAHGRYCIFLSIAPLISKELGLPAYMREWDTQSVTCTVAIRLKERFPRIKELYIIS